MITSGHIKKCLTNLSVKRIGYYNNSIEGEAEFNHYRYCCESDPYSPQIRYTAESDKIVIRIPSISIFAFKDPLQPLSDDNADYFKSLIYDYMLSNFDISGLIEPDDWLVEAPTDVYWDFYVSDDVQNYLQALSNVRIPKYKQGNYALETVFWRTDYREIKVYDKYQQLKDKSIPMDDITRAKGILRFEVGIHATDLISACGSTRFGDILHESVIHPLIRKYLNKIGGNLSFTTEFDTLKILLKHYPAGTAVRLLGYICAMQTGLKRFLPQPTEYRYLKDIRRVGLKPSFSTISLPPLSMARQEAHC